MFGWFKKDKVKVNLVHNNTNPKISVVMPVYLGKYEGCATDRVNKFKSAVMSFIHQSYNNKELIIVSDGCEETTKIVKELFVYDNIFLVSIPKQPLFSGNVRAEGVNNSNGDIICYLDSDDMIGTHHLQTIAQAFENIPELEWVYYNDLILMQNKTPMPRNVELEKGLAGTSCVAHRKYCEASWLNCDNYNHDWLFIEQLIKNNSCRTKIYGAEYYVCHIPNLF